jgi:hypothetical protein
LRIDNLDGPAELTVWCAGSIKAVEPLPFATLRAALHEAGRVLAMPGLQPWIVTADGLILTPAWLEANHERFHSPPNRSGGRGAPQAGSRTTGSRSSSRHRARSAPRRPLSRH